MVQNKVLLILVHPALEKSVLNAELLAEAQACDGVTVHDLYQSYPYFEINETTEQALLAAHDIVIFQHPFYWYSVPALMKQWLEVALAYGFAYGESGAALQGKLWLNAVTTGANAAAYTPSGENQMTIWELMAPLRATARSCQMHFLPPAVFFHASSMGTSSQRMQQARLRYRVLLTALQTTPLHELQSLQVDNLLDWSVLGDLW